MSNEIEKTDQEPVGSGALLDATPLTTAICAAINAALKPYPTTTATAMLLLNQYLKIRSMEEELNRLRATNAPDQRPAD